MRKLLILFISVMCFGLGQAQINIASGGTVTAGSCGNTFVDSGGAGGDYLNGESHQITICPDTPGTYIQLEFITFNTESATWDPFIVYEGTGTGGTVIGTYGGDPAFSTTLPPDIGACAGGTYIASSDPSGCITITFTSDGSGIDPGWEADIVCTTTAGGDAITGGTTPPANSVCGGSGAFCADAGALEFANTSDADCVPDADPATVANSCLGSAPNPAWYFIEIGQAGDIIIDISQTTGAGGTGTALDVDYVVWGPFNDPADACTDFTQGDCTADHTCTGNVVDCSFDFAATETATIPGAQVGEFYMFLITNFNGSAGFITLDQTNAGAGGAGSTDCCPFEAGVDPTTCGATDGEINISLLLANTSYTITYDDPLGNPQSITTTSDATGLISITGLGAGTYTNIDTGTAGCSTATITLTAGAAPVFNTLTSNDPVCSGEDAVFTLSGTAGATVDYTTTTNGAQSVVLDGAGNATITISGITADETINLTQISLAGCNVALANTTTVTVGAGPTADASPNTTPICEGSTAVFDITGTPNAVVTYNTGGANTTITLNGAGTASVSIPGATAASEVINLVSVANAGAPVPGVGASATGGQNPGNAAGAIEALGTDLSAAGLAARVTNGAPSLVITLQHTVPAGTSITVSIARDNNAGAATITDGTANLNFSAGPNDDSQQVTFVTGVATNTITINRTGGAVWVDGVSYTFSSTGCTVPLTDSETVVVNPIPAVPIINTVAPTCAADGNSTVTNYNAALTYTFTPAGPTVGAGGAISGMILGTAYTVTAGDGTCTSVASAGFTNLTQLTIPVVPTINTVAPTCAADGNSTVTNYNAALTYNFTPAGPTVGAGGAISGMTVGTAYTVIADNGSCTSTASAGFTNVAMLVTPAVPTINTVAPTCAADGNSTVTNYNAALTYTFAPAGPTVGAGGAISGMTVGTAYTVTAGNGSCTSVASAGFTNLAMLVTPAVPTINTVAPTCAADGNSTVTNYNAAITYTFTPAGPTVGAGGAISGMTVGTAYTVTAGNGSCTSVASAGFTNVAMLITPAVPTINTVAPTCTADGNSTVTNYNAALTYTFTPAGPSVGAGGAITGMTLGTAYTVTAGNGSCTSVASAGFTNLAMLVTPAVPTINTVAPTCAADGNSTVTNYNAAFTYTFTPAGPTVGAGGAISGMTVGTAYTVTAGNGSCTSVASAGFTNVAMLVTPAVPAITTIPPSCVADGSSSITNYNAAVTYTFTPVGPTVGVGGAISGMTLGTAYTVTAGNGSCTSVVSAGFTNLAMLSTQPTPTINTVAPTCAADGNSTVTNYNAAITYTFTPAGPTVGAGGAISGMTFGTAYTVTANIGACISVASAGFTNLAMLVTPAVPTINTVAPTCVADGNSTVTNYNAALTYAFTPAGPTVGAGGAISGMTLGTAYTVIADNGSCTSVASAGFTNVAMLITPAVPTINTVAPT